jgi:hypothetical protein
MRRALALVVVLTFLSANLMLAQSQRPFRIDQIEQLIPVLPDRTLAREIRQRGTAFRVDPSVLKHLKDAGAGIETVAALTELLPRAELAIVSVPSHCEILLNGHPYGQTDDAGKLTISELDAGRSSLQVSKDGYRSQTYDVALGQSKTTELLATLKKIVGYLSVSTTPLSTSISVRPTNRGDKAGDLGACTALSGPSNIWECVPGEYTVRVSSVGFHSAIENARVIDGETTNVTLDLPPESTAPGSGLASPKKGPHVDTESANRVNEGKSGNDSASVRLLGLVQDAMGGKDKIAAIRDWQRRAKETWEPSRGMTEETTMFVAPSSLREETKGGNKTVNYSNGVRGWTWSSSLGVSRDLPIPTATGMLFRTLSTLVLSDNDPEIKASLIVPGTIIFSDKYHNTATLTVDPHSWLPRRLAWRNLDGAIMEETYSDWRKIGGVMTWFHMTRARDGNRFLEVRVRDYRINTGVTAAHLSAAP